MSQALKLCVLVASLLAISAPMFAQETPEAPEGPGKPAVDSAAREFEEVVEQVDQSQQAQEVKSNILKPIYSLAERFSFPSFYWVAFAVMVTGVVSFALQLVLGKVIVLSRLSMSPTEILSDVLGLVVSVVGLVLTTQAATENSSFTSSAFAVISSTTIGGLLGIVFYIWGQRQELQAAEGRRRVAGKQTSTDQRAHA